MDEPLKSSLRNYRAAWLYLVVLALLLYAVLPQLGIFKKSLPLLDDISPHWLVLAIAFSLVAHTVAGFKYVALALKPIRLVPAVLVQLASLLVNRLLPAGIGGLGINYAFLRKAKHSKVEAGIVVSMNNLAGLVGHMLLVGSLVVIAPSASQHLNLRISSRAAAIVIGMIVIAIVLVYLLRTRMEKAFKQLSTSLRYYRMHPLKFIVAIVWSAVIAAAYAACLWGSAHALHFQLDFLPALVVLTLGVAASSVSPTPGGLVGVEAALVLGLVAYGLTGSAALAVALLFRLITYWFALFLGAVAFIIVRSVKYI